MMKELSFGLNDGRGYGKATKARDSGASRSLPRHIPAIRGLLLALALLLCSSGLAEAAGRELSGYFGGAIGEAAEALGGLTFEAGEEYAESYISDALALRGNGGTVTCIDLKPENTSDTLYGIRNGMTREQALALMEGVPQMWDYPEELAWLIHADPEDELKDEILVVFFDENENVSGAWYRVSGM